MRPNEYRTPLACGSSEAELKEKYDLNKETEAAEESRLKTIKTLRDIVGRLEKREMVVAQFRITVDVNDDTEDDDNIRSYQSTGITEYRLVTFTGERNGT